VWHLLCLSVNPPILSYKKDSRPIFKFHFIPLLQSALIIFFFIATSFFSQVFPKMDDITGKVTACYQFHVTNAANTTPAGHDHLQLQEGGDDVEKINLKLPRTSTLFDAIDELWTHLSYSPAGSGAQFISHIVSIHCKGTSIRSLLKNTSIRLVDIHDTSTPIENSPIHVTVNSPLSGCTITFTSTNNTSKPGNISGSSSPTFLIGSTPDPERESTISTVTGSQTCPIDGFQVFVDLQCQRLAISTGYHQFTAFNSDSFGDLFYCVVEFHKDRQRIGADAAQILIVSPVTVIYFSTPKSQLKDMIKGSLESTCEAIRISQNWYVRFTSIVESSGQSKIILSGEEVNNMLMQSQRRSVLPEKMILHGNDLAINIPFPISLYNFLVESMENSHLGVPPDSLNILKEVTRAIRDMLQRLPQRISKVKLPERFHHNLKRFDDRDRTAQTQASLINVASKLLATMQKASFLATQRWQSFHDDMKLLYNLVMGEVESMKIHSKNMSVLQNSEGSIISERLRNKIFIPGKPNIKVAPCYVPLTRLLIEKGDFNHVLVSTNDIDQWVPPNHVNESNESARKRRQVFRDSLQANFSITTFQYHAGGSLPLLFVAWKVPDNDSSASGINSIYAQQELQCEATILDALPRYTTRIQWRTFQTHFGDAIGGGVPAGMLRVMYRHLTKDGSAPRFPEQEERVMHYAIATGDPDLWPDL
jgi:hypothetical protein